MTTAVQRRRGTKTEHESFTGLEGEITVNTTNESLHVHDGSTTGGFETMRADGSNATSLNLNSTTNVDGVIDDDTLATASATKLATSESIKAYVDGQSYVTDGDKGDVVVSSSGSVWTVESAAGDLDVTGAINSSSLVLSSGTPIVTFEESDGNTGYNRTTLEQAGDQYFQRTRNSSGTSVGIDYVATKGASGATAQAWRIANATKMLLNSTGLDVEDKVTASAVQSLANTSTASTTSGLVGGRDGAQYINLHGSGAANFISAVSSSANPKGFTIRSSTDSGSTYPVQLTFQSDDSGIALSGDLNVVDDLDVGGIATIENAAPILALNETGVDSDYSGTWFVLDGANMRIQTRTNAGAQVSNDYQLTKNASGATAHIWSIADSEAAMIDSSGNFLVGKSSNAIGTVGVEARANGQIFSTVDGDGCLELNRLTNSGKIIEFMEDTSTVGTIGSDNGNALYIGSSGVGTSYVRFFNNGMRPATSSGGNNDNTMDLGVSVARWDDVYATNGTIQTSDEREKTDIADLDEAEKRVAIAAKGLIRKYRWKSSVEKKGDEARIHFGIIAQDLKAAFEAEGLDAGRYAMFIHSEWWEHDVEVPAVEAQDAVYEDVTIPSVTEKQLVTEAVIDDEGNEVEPAVYETVVIEEEHAEQRLVSEAVEAEEAYTRTDTYETEEEAPEGAIKKDRMGVRYSELLAFIIAAL